MTKVFRGYYECEKGKRQYLPLNGGVVLQRVHCPCGQCEGFAYPVYKEFPTEELEHYRAWRGRREMLELCRLRAGEMNDGKMERALAKRARNAKAAEREAGLALRKATELLG
jgi:hypothetical protein